MTIVLEPFAVDPKVLKSPDRAWRPMYRIESTGGNVTDVIKGIQEFAFERLIYAEGDSWFDKFTPIPLSGTNLLDAVRTPFVSGVVDVSHIGDEVGDMVRGHQAKQTSAMFKLFDFDAILLSAGGNDLKNLFAELFDSKAKAGTSMPDAFGPADLRKLASPETFDQFFDVVAANIQRFIDLRDKAGRERTRLAPLILHGYDYLQPRPAGAAVFAGTRVGKGPWIYPALKEAGLSDAQMRSAADVVIDELNKRLAALASPARGVYYVNHRGLLTPAAPGTVGESNDWTDEIHPTEAGFTRLARNRWDVLLGTALRWTPGPTDLKPADEPKTKSMAAVDGEGHVA
jgi:lysophospholipase L1-like esterase